MRIRFGLFVSALCLLALPASAQQVATSPNPGQMYCSGLVTNQRVPTDTYLITGEQSEYKITFDDNDYVYINKGSNQGVKAGDQFLVMRPVTDPDIRTWFTWQRSLMRAMGSLWDDEGRLTVVAVHPNVSIAQVVNGCSYLQRGDIVVPFADRPAPQFKPAQNYDRFAPPSGKALAMVVNGKDFQVDLGTDDIIYVNLGSAQGVKVGDYFRIFRYQDHTSEVAYETRGMATHVYGFGAAPGNWTWDKLPRENLGEGIVLRVSPNSATVLITYSLREIFPGNYVELE